MIYFFLICFLGPVNANKPNEADLGRDAKNLKQIPFSSFAKDNLDSEQDNKSEISRLDRELKENSGKNSKSLLS